MSARHVDIDAYLDGALDAAGRAAADAHLERCARCRAGLDAAQRLQAAIASQPVPDPGRAYWARFASRVEARLAPRSGGLYERLFGWFVPAGRWGALRAATAVASATLLVYVGMRGFRPADLRPPGVEPSPPPASSPPEIGTPPTDIGTPPTVLPGPGVSPPSGQAGPGDSRPHAGVAPKPGPTLRQYDAKEGRRDGVDVTSPGVQAAPAPAPSEVAQTGAGPEKPAESGPTRSATSPAAPAPVAPPPAAPEPELATGPAPAEQPVQQSTEQAAAPRERTDYRLEPTPSGLAKRENAAARALAARDAAAQLSKGRESPALETRGRADLGAVASPDVDADPVVAFVVAAVAGDSAAATAAMRSPGLAAEDAAATRRWLASDTRAAGPASRRKAVALAPAPAERWLELESLAWPRREMPALRSALESIARALASEADSDRRAAARARRLAEWLAATSASASERAGWEAMLQTLPPP